MRRLLKYQNKRSMKVLSLFDGMSCGQIALNRLGIKYDTYYVSEIDKYAIKVTQNNYPNTIQIGDVTRVKAEDVGEIDLLLGGSPCQGFSFAGHQLNFEDPRSKLFFEYVRLLNELKPKYFLLENVKMKKESRDIISKYLGVEPIEIDSKTITSGRRNRLYWTNIPNVPELKEIESTFQSILDNGITDKDKAYCLTLHRGNLRDYFKKKQSNIVYLPSEEGKYEVKNGTIKMTFPKGKNPGEVFTFKTNVPDGRYNFRPLTTDEECRLQGVPVGYFKGITANQSSRLLGNGWTVDVICHILKNISHS